MSADWAGFSEEEVQRIQAKSNYSSEVVNNRCRGKLMQQKKSVKSKQICSGIQNVPVCISESVSSGTHSQTTKTTLSRTSKKMMENNHVAFEESTEKSVKVIDKYKKNATDAQTGSVKNANIPEKNSDLAEGGHEVDLSAISKSALEVLEEKRKNMEIENARRKAIIAKAVLDRKKKTEAEAQKLSKIQKELNHLDCILSSDVSILRDHIEKASIEFSEAEKRYLKAEKEFIEAKTTLYQKMEKKEKLTEHLYAIIEQNENRKAKRLLELMQQLEMDVSVNDCIETVTEPILLSLPAFSDMNIRNSTIKYLGMKENVMQDMEEIQNSHGKTDASNEIKTSENYAKLNNLTIEDKEALVIFDKPVEKVTENYCGL